MLDSQAVQASIISGLLFLLVSSPFLYKLVNGLLGRFVPISNAAGCPTTAGLLIHGAVFAILTYGLMYLGKMRKEAETQAPVPAPVAPAPVMAPQTPTGF